MEDFILEIHKFRNASFFVNIKPPRKISGLRHEVDQNCAILGYNAACNVSSLPIDS